MKKLKKSVKNGNEKPSKKELARRLTRLERLVEKLSFDLMNHGSREASSGLLGPVVTPGPTYTSKCEDGNTASYCKLASQPVIEKPKCSY